MGQRAAMRMLTASPRSAADTSDAVIMPVSAPRRRWVERVVTLVTASAVTIAPPGTVSSAGNDASVATTCEPSRAAQLRSRSAVARR